MLKKKVEDSIGRNGLWQLELDKESSELWTFNTPFGTRNISEEKLLNF